jgi:hypothetical protein
MLLSHFKLRAALSASSRLIGRTLFHDTQLWLDTAASTFKMIYKDSPDKIPPLPYSK